MRTQALIMVVVSVLLLLGYATSLWFAHVGLAQWVTAGILLGAIISNVLALVYWHRGLKTLNTDEERWWHTAGTTFYETLLAVLLVGVIIEIPHFQHAIRYQVASLLEFPKLFANEDELRSRFTKSELKLFRSSITNVLRTRDPVSDEDRLLEARIFPVLDGPARDSLEITRNHRRETSPEGREFYVVDETTEYVEYSAGRDSLRLPLGVTTSPILGVPRESLYCVRSVSLDGHQIETPVMEGSADLQGGNYEFKCKSKGPPTKRVEVRTFVRKRVLTDDRFTAHVRFPTHSLRIRLLDNGITEHEAGEPKLYVFTTDTQMSGKQQIEPRTRQPGLREWYYPGWLWVMQGWEVTWQRP